MLVICRMSLRAGERRGEGGREGSGVLHHMFVRSGALMMMSLIAAARASSSTQMSHTDVLFLLFHLERDPTASTKLRSFLILRPLNVALSVGRSVAVVARDLRPVVLEKRPNYYIVGKGGNRHGCCATNSIVARD